MACLNQLTDGEANEASCKLWEYSGFFNSKCLEAKT